MTMVAKQFDPSVYEACVLFGETYVVQPHPASPTRRYAQKGGRGRVFQLRHKRSSSLWALKVFDPRYRVSSLSTMAQQLSLVEGYEGMHAAKRRVILPSDPVVGVYPNLEYAMMIPWIHGKTWFDLLVEAGKGSLQLSTPASLRLCRRFLEVIAGLEASGMAHTDLAPGNVVFELSSYDVQLLDLEDMYMPDAPSAKMAKGSKGYRHACGDTSGVNFWRADGDRYSAAVLAAEILILSNHGLARRVTEEGYFADHRLDAQAAARFGDAKGWLSKIAPTFATLFERAWLAETIAECPRVSDLCAAAQEDARNTPPKYENKGGVLAHNTPAHDFANWIPQSPAPARTVPATQTVWRPLQQQQPPAQVAVRSNVPATRPPDGQDALAKVAAAVVAGGAVVGLVAFLIWLLLRLL